MRDVIAYAVQGEHTTQEIANEFRVKRHVVDALMRNERRGINTIEQIEASEKDDLIRRNIIADEVRKLLQNGSHLW